MGGQRQTTGILAQARTAHDGVLQAKKTASVISNSVVKEDFECEQTQK